MGKFQYRHKITKVWERKFGEPLPTLKDVAEEAGVTPATVSMVINNKPNISKQTKEKVWEVIKRLGYHPNFIARGLATNKTNTIAVVIPDLSSLFALEVLRGIRNKISDESLPIYNIILFDMVSYYKSKNLKEVFRRIVGERRADGLIIVGHTDEDALTILEENNIPFILVSVNNPKYDCIYSNDRLGAYIGVEYLLSKGYKDIAIVYNRLVYDRLMGYMEVLKNNNLEIKDENLIESKSMDVYAGYEIGEKLVNEGFSFDALFVASNDLTAIGIMKILLKNNIKIPEQLAIMGYDDIPASELIVPSLSTIKQPLQGLGKEALVSIIDKIEGDNKEKISLILKPTLIERETT